MRAEGSPCTKPSRSRRSSPEPQMGGFPGSDSIVVRRDYLEVMDAEAIGLMVSIRSQIDDAIEYAG